MYRLWIVQSNHPREALVGAERVATHPSRELPWLFDYRKSVSRNDRANPFAGRVFGKVEVNEVLSTSAPNGNRDSPPSSDCLVTSMTYARMIVTHSNRVGGVNSAL